MDPFKVKIKSIPWFLRKEVTNHANNIATPFVAQFLNNFLFQPISLLLSIYFFIFLFSKCLNIFSFYTLRMFLIKYDYSAFPSLSHLLSLFIYKV